MNFDNKNIDENLFESIYYNDDIIINDVLTPDSEYADYITDDYLILNNTDGNNNNIYEEHEKINFSPKIENIMVSETDKKIITIKWNSKNIPENIISNRNYKFMIFVSKVNDNYDYSSFDNIIKHGGVEIKNLPYSENFFADNELDISESRTDYIKNFSDFLNSENCYNIDTYNGLYIDYLLNRRIYESELSLNSHDDSFLYKKNIPLSIGYGTFIISICFILKNDLNNNSKHIMSYSSTKKSFLIKPQNFQPLSIYARKIKNGSCLINVLPSKSNEDQFLFVKAEKFNFLNNKWEFINISNSIIEKHEYIGFFVSSNSSNFPQKNIRFYAYSSSIKKYENNKDLNYFIIDEKISNLIYSNVINMETNKDDDFIICSICQDSIEFKENNNNNNFCCLNNFDGNSNNNNSNKINCNNNNNNNNNSNNNVNKINDKNNNVDNTTNNIKKINNNNSNNNNNNNSNNISGEIIQNNNNNNLKSINQNEEINQDFISLPHNCSHVFHSNCIDKWISLGNNDCPECKTKFFKMVKLKNFYSIINIFEYNSKEKNQSEYNLIYEKRRKRQRIF